MSPVATTLLILAVAVVAFLSDRVPLGVVAIGVSLSLWATGILDLSQALAGFGDPTVVFVATLFVVAEALDSTGVTAWAGRQVVARGGDRRAPLLVVLCLLVAALTALISVNGAVAALLPVAVVVAGRAGLPPSQMLMPVAFSAHAGSMLALTGTPVNIIVSDAASDAGARPFGFVEFTLVGVPLLLGTVLVLLTLGPRLLPDRQPAHLPADLGDLAQVLRKQYDLSDAGGLVGTARGVAEVVLPPRSPLIGTHLFPGMTTPSGDLVVLAVQRAGDPLSGPQETLRAGDSLLLGGAWDKLALRTGTGEVLVVDDPATLRRTVPLGRGAKRTVGILLVMVVLLATGVVPAAVAGLLAACAVVLGRVLSPAEAYRSVSWTAVVLIAGMIPLSTAFMTTGTADAIASRLLDAVGGGSPHLALLVVCLLTMALGQLISNTATVLIVAPVAVVVAADLDASVLPFMMALAVSGAAAFLTPVATAANTMVLEPGGYRFSDYWKLGLPLNGLFLAVAVLYVPLVWPF